jgi:arylsulfatase A-like enzyme
MRFHLTLAIILFSTVALRAADQPNIILCMADDQGYGDVGYYGNDVIKTPVLDAMSKSGLRFDRFYAACPVCSPTRGSVMTGRHPNRFGCFKWGYTLRPQEVTIAEAVKKKGYATGHFGKWHLGSCRAESPASPGNSGFDVWASAPNFFDNDPLLSHNGKVVQHEGESSAVTVKAALKFIRDQVKQDKPFLAVIWFGSPHSPHKASPENLALYPDATKANAHYMGEITGIDTAMGQLRKEIGRLGIADETLLWYTSDNGPQGPEGRGRGSSGGLRGRKGSLWEGGVRVPTIIEWPSVVTRNRITDVPCSTIDIYPTIVDLLDIKIEHQPVLDGVSILPLIEGKPFQRHKPMGFWDFAARGIPRRAHDLLAVLKKEQDTGAQPGVDVTHEGEITKQYPLDEYPGPASWVDGDWKLLRLPKQRNKPAGPFDDYLFNLAKDRNETDNLADRDPERVQAMTKSLEQWQTSVLRSLNGEDYVE